ncbi:hypothetical protein ON010_g4177 [Phytophthora cinnamomi]|nr:hypothetical protein ON010_g4177 [Phytophthora cinnamomi]
MVDLAGSERLKKSESDGQRLKEALHINSSLSAVGKVVMSLDPESGYNYIPYRDSKLTRLLQNSIGGNCFTTLIATIHPMKEHYEECLGTLQFANRCRSVQNQASLVGPRVNHINGTIADKDRRIRKLQEELSILRRQVEGLRAEYNNRFVATLNELGFQAEEISESGEIKFADGLVLKSVFADDDQGDHLPASSAFLKSRHVGPTGHVQSLLRTDGTSDRDRLRQKYANAKSNFTVVVTEAKKDKENARQVINEQKRRIASLEGCLQQKSSEYERALASEAARHRAEMQDLLSRNNQTHVGVSNQNPFQQYSTSTINPVDATGSSKDHEKQFDQRSKENEVALIRQQYEQSLKNKTDELNETNLKLQQMQLTTTETMDMATAAARLPLQHPRSAASIPSVMDRIKPARPLSAPVRRTKPTYAAALRDRVNQPFIDPFTVDDNENIAFDGRPNAVRPPLVVNHDDDSSEDSLECRRLMRLLEEEHKKTRALKAANAALTRQNERNGSRS